MTESDRTMWIINIENAASIVATEYGNEVALSIFRRYDAHGIYDLNPCCYPDVFADLEQVAFDN